VLTPFPYVKSPWSQARAPSLFVVLGPTALADQGNGDGANPQVAGRACPAACLHQGINRRRKGPIPEASPRPRLRGNPNSNTRAASRASTPPHPQHPQDLGQQDQPYPNLPGGTELHLPAQHPSQEQSGVQDDVVWFD
jgi:hypothetical protein